MTVERIDLVSSRLGWVSGSAGGLLTGGFALWAMIENRQIHWIAGSFFAIGVFIVGVFLLDYPFRSILSADGIERRCLGRVQRFAWSEVVELTRAPTGLIERMTGRDVGRAGSKDLDLGALLIRVDRRRYQLASRTESPDQFDEIVAGLNRWRAGVHLAAMRPPERR